MASNLSNTQSAVIPHNHPISDITNLSTQLGNKQDKLEAGSNITIGSDGKTISAIDTKYSAGANISIDSDNKINAVDTKYDNATQTVAGLMSADDKKKLDGIEEGAGAVKVTGVKGDAETNYREGNVNITKANIGLGNVDNTSDANKPISTVTQAALDLKQNIADMPTKLTDFTNDGDGTDPFITKAVNDLTNYYTKTQTYTKSEVNTLISNFGGFEVVATLPTSDIKPNVIYLLGPIGTGADKYQEYIYYNNTWTLIGETTVDLTNYAQKSEVLTKTNTTAFTPTGNYNPATKKYVDDGLSEKQDALTAGEGITIENNVISSTGSGSTDYSWVEKEVGNVGYDYSAMQGPAPSGFHVPLQSEWQGLKTIMDGLSLTTGDNWRINLHMPFAGRRLSSSAALGDQGSFGYYWSSSPYGSDAPFSARSLYLYSSIVDADNDSRRASGFSVRCFKDSYVAPDSSWTVVQGTLGSAGIFWNQTEGLISITDGTTGYTIQDKNLGATAVYNDGDALTQDNMGNMYQWGNNYGFPSTGSVTTSSTQVDASAYGPGNYYSSSTFITGNQDWSSVQNDNLRGGVTGAQPLSGFELSLRTIAREPSDDFTLIAPSSIKDGEEYVLRCVNVNSYTLTLGTGFTNPFNVDLTLSANATDQFVFLAVQGTLELQPLFNN